MTRLLRGRTVDGERLEYRLGEIVAMRLERATVDAWTRGEVTVLPLRAIDLLGGAKAA